jgi:hypothetical protein
MVRSAGLNGHAVASPSEWGFVDADRPLSIVRRHELGRLQCMVGIAARRRVPFSCGCILKATQNSPAPPCFDRRTIRLKVRRRETGHGVELS